VSDLEEAARRVAAGDRAAFDTIVRSTQQTLLRAAARILGNREEALDVLQEAYVRAFDALVASGDDARSEARFDGRARVSSWLYRVVMNASLDALRSRRRRPTVPLLDHDVEGSGPDAEARVALADLGRMLDLLPEDQRAALVLRELEGLSNAEAAAVLETTEGAIEQRLIRARATLRRRSDES
jgi:RNA polymerase sigma-70 factor, ECF subfamily